LYLAFRCDGQVGQPYELGIRLFTDMPATSGVVRFRVPAASFVLLPGGSALPGNTIELLGTENVFAIAAAASALSAAGDRHPEKFRANGASLERSREPLPPDEP
jgi:hypothetical protein